MGVTDDTRSACRATAASAQQVRIVPGALDRVTAGAVPPLDPGVHFVDGDPAAVAAYVLVLDAINFGSGWFAELPGLGYEPVAQALTDYWRAEGPLDAAALRAADAAFVADLLGQPAEHALIGLYARGLQELGGALGDRTALEVVRDCEPSAERVVTWLSALPMWRDTGFLKRAQIAASDLALAGVARFTDLHRLTAFADNVLPQVLRHDGVLEVVDPALAARIDRSEVLAPGPAERELRACAVRACELLAAHLGLTERELDNVLWTRGQAPAYAKPPLPHRTLSTFY
ncbi:queuosine salvage family protein [Paraconexibacter sp. AEG42_29]|uniref:queuosine salvage family protein n=1 Tax=Paraconexibacter sp. AEG42_29 TaxID=2997339 RepID=UPI00339D7CCE